MHSIPTTLTRRALAATLCALVPLAACGDDGDEPGEVAGVTGETSADASGDLGEGDDGGGDGEFDCPLTAEEVGELLGADVEKDEATCSYAPGGNVGSVPSASFIAQLPEPCTEDFLAQQGFTERLDLLDEEAYLKASGDSRAEAWVCGDRSFSVSVDLGPDSGGGAAAAETLAMMALEAG
jgi:hypothetical protein